MFPDDYHMLVVLSYYYLFHCSFFGNAIKTSLNLLPWDTTACRGQRRRSMLTCPLGAWPWPESSGHWRNQRPPRWAAWGWSCCSDKGSRWCDSPRQCRWWRWASASATPAWGSTDTGHTAWRTITMPLTRFCSARWLSRWVQDFWTSERKKLMLGSKEAFPLSSRYSLRPTCVTMTFCTYLDLKMRNKRRRNWLVKNNNPSVPLQLGHVADKHRTYVCTFEAGWGPKWYLELYNPRRPEQH